MGDVVFLRKDFEGARRQRLIAGCLELSDKAGELFALQPGISDTDAQFLAMDHTPAEKFDCLARYIPENRDDLPPMLHQKMRLLVAGVIMFERLRQTREWLGFYEGYDGRPIAREEMDQFPRLNVRREVAAQIYDSVLARSHPTHVEYALKTSDRAFVQVKTADKSMRGIAWAPRLAL